jgi:hypothetical protein
MRPTDRPIRVPGVEVHAVEDGCVIFAPTADEVHFLNATAQRVLELCDGSRIIADMQAEFGDVDAVGFDVQSGILDQFERAGLVVAARPESPESEDA